MYQARNIFAKDKILELSLFKKVLSYGRKILSYEPLDNPKSTTYGWGDLEGEVHDFDNIPDMVRDLAENTARSGYFFNDDPVETSDIDGPHTLKRALSPNERLDAMLELKKHGIHSFYHLS